MSIEALAWALEQAPDVAPHELPTLIGLANHAHADGTAAYPAVPKLAGYARKGDRAVQRDLASLLEKGVIRLGDQRHVAHIPADRRPVVYDLALERRMDGGVVQPPKRPVSGRPAAPIGQPAQQPAAGDGSRPGAKGQGASSRADRKPWQDQAPKNERRGADPVPDGEKCVIHLGYLKHNCGGCKVDRQVALREQAEAKLLAAGEDPEMLRLINELADRLEGSAA
ncbi:hypothetical protein [Actinoplanes sp. NPDC026670]|uniref:hypothetical protein n=1 Tax=Actinoplanes sp. NPDC026670 TaxID=3154700 RepID=UPI003404EE6D